jgi:DNA-binding NarL/FixJ family response regulator
MRILLVDDHKMFVQALKLLLRELRPQAEVLLSHSPMEARTLIESRPEAFDIIFLDLKMPGFQRLEALSYFRGLCPEVPCVILTSDEDSDLVLASVNMGAYAFVSKSAGLDSLQEPLDRVVSGNVWLPASAVSVNAPRTSQDMWSRAGMRITARQRDVLRLLVQGKTDKMIARGLGISDGTVKTHMAHLRELLSVNTRTEIVYALARQGIRIQDIPTSTETGDINRG